MQTRRTHTGSLRMGARNERRGRCRLVDGRAAVRRRCIRVHCRVRVWEEIKVKAKYAALIRVGIRLARDREWGDYGASGWALSGEILVLNAFARERGNMRRRGEMA